MRGQTVILSSRRARDIACNLVMQAPDRALVNVRKPVRTMDQNAKMWALLSDVSRAKPEGRQWTPETWKAAFMHALGHQVQFAEGLDGSGPFPLGFQSSRLVVSEMADLITLAQEYGDRHGVRWSNEAPA